MKVNHRGMKPADDRPARPSRLSAPPAPPVAFPWNAIAAQVKAKAATVLGAWLTDDDGDSTESVIVIRIRGPRVMLRAFASALKRSGQ